MSYNLKCLDNERDKRCCSRRRSSVGRRSGTWNAGKWIHRAAVTIVVGLSASLCSRAAAPAAETDSIVQANMRFGLKLFRELARSQNGENIFISPASVAFALDLAYNGAAGTAKQAIAHTLALDGLSLADVNQANADVRKALERPTPHVQLAIANAVWINRGTTLRPEFLQRLHDFYAADIATVDMHSAAAPKAINQWVSRKTHEKIKNLVGPGDLRPPADAVLTDAAYFKGDWKVAFDRAKTAPRPFRLPGGRQKMLPMMFEQGRFAYLQGDHFQAVGLPYGDGSLSMLVFLPAPDSSLPAFLASLTDENWTRWMGQLHQTKLSGLYLPRFRVEYGASLKPALCALGMAPAFNGGDFTPMGLRGDAIGNVKHKAVLEVNEEGTEAAAATAIVMTRAITRDVVVTIDRPFFCAIRDNRTGSILFMGAIEEPE